MKKNIVIVTGASSGIGKTLSISLKEKGPFDEVWVIARTLNKLEELTTILPFKTVVLPLDLSNSNSFSIYEDKLKNESPNVKYLFNCSGFGKFQATIDTALEDNLNMVDLNCKAVMALCQITIPYMNKNSHIVNIASVAAFQPIPYINVYAATKAFVLSYSRALNRELKSKGIHVMAVCPFWTKTAFFDRAIQKNEDAIVKKYVAMYTPEQIVNRIWRDLKRGKDVSKFGFIARFQAFLAKILPHSFVMTYWMNQQKLK
ncbi:MAG: SDR family NAD(P)-dependent oxidoreductase [Sphaerochaetaceae bacterium]|nr:SDR family NAD(P)-dependent oxidoreductase [Sphaerochaetaceae bacterium]